MFKHLKQQVQDNFQKMLSLTDQLFYVTIDRDVIWDKYLLAFEESNQQDHNCNCCKSFLRQYGGIVAIIDNKRVSLWDDIDAPDEYKNSIQELKEYIHSLPITDIFLNEFPKCGTDKNKDLVRDVTWEHFFITLPPKFVNKTNIDTVRGEKRTAKQTLERALKELTIDATQTVLELIAQKSLYRGNEFESILNKFLPLQKRYKESFLTDEERENFVWITSLKEPFVCGIRNGAIGTLLIDLSADVDLDTAVGKFEAVMAPANYKRPTALITPKMVEQAKEKLVEMGLTDSLERRHAIETDVNVEDIIYKDNSSTMKGDVFDAMAKDAAVNPKNYSKVDEVSIEEFITKVVPTSKSIEVLVENRHLVNLVTLVTGVIATAKSLFKWDNLFSWSYINGIADSMKERVKAAGGNVDGVLRYSIQWNEDGKNVIDFDAHAMEPNGTKIHYSTEYRKDRGGAKTIMSGQLDVDMIDPSGVGVENITWTDLNKMKEGKYIFLIHNFSSRTSRGGFKAEIEFDGQVHEFEYAKNLKGGEYIPVAEVTYSKAEGFSIKPLLDSTSSVSSIEKWGIKTNQFTKVKKIMLSPNHWNGKVGNKHYMFFLENCIADESPRPFFNEFLKPEFNENRKVFEVMASKMKVEHSDNQLSGVGFSETQKNSMLVRVDGNFKRVLKVNF